MPNYNPNADPRECSDGETSLGRNATNATERRQTLAWCLSNVWADKNIGALERWDDANWHGWLMWTWKRR